MNYYTLILIIVSVISAIVEAYYDSKKLNPSHLLSAIVRGLVSFGLCWLLFLGFWFQLVNALSMLVAFWIVFDPSYNLWCGYKINRMGRTSFLDRMALKMGGDMYSYTAFKGFIFIILLTILNYI